MAEISIIVPVYNVEKYLRRCLDSILAQTYTDYEIILVNDGSTDGSLSICEEYARANGKIKIVSKENGGISSARNAGIREAAGKYIMFCDSDDYVHKTWCERLVRTAERHPEALIACDVAFAEPGKGEEDKIIEKTGEIALSYLDLFKLGVSPYSCNKIFRTEIIKDIDLLFDENRRFGEDVGFVVEYCKHCSEIYFISEKLYYYVQVDGSLMHRYYPNLLELHLDLFYCRTVLMNKDELKDYCDIWVYTFYNLLDNVFDERNTEMSFVQKMNFNRRMVKTPQFMFCVDNASGKNESPRFMKLLRKHNYDLIWLFKKITGSKK